MQETHQHTLIHYTTHFRSTEGLLAEERGAEPAGRVDPEEGAGLAEGAEGLRGGAGARPVRVLLAAELDSEPPVVGRLAAVAGQEPREPRQLHVGRLRPELRRGPERDEQVLV